MNASTEDSEMKKVTMSGADNYDSDGTDKQLLLLTPPQLLKQDEEFGYVNNNNDDTGTNDDVDHNDVDVDVDVDDDDDDDNEFNEDATTRSTRSMTSSLPKPMIMTSQLPKPIQRVRRPTEQKKDDAAEFQLSKFKEIVGNDAAKEILKYYKSLSTKNNTVSATSKTMIWENQDKFVKSIHHDHPKITKKTLMSVFGIGPNRLENYILKTGRTRLVGNRTLSAANKPY